MIVKIFTYLDKLFHIVKPQARLRGACLWTCKMPCALCLLRCVHSEAGCRRSDVRTELLMGPCL